MHVLMVTVRLRMQTPGGVTAPEASTEQDNVLPIRTELHGQPHLPGTTVAGSLRAVWSEKFGEASAKDLFGHIAHDDTDSRRRSDSPTRFPSKIQVLGTQYREAPESQRSGSGDDAQDEKRTFPVHHRTAISRRRGAPRTHALHGVEFLPAGTEFDIVFRWNDPDSQQREQFVNTLRSWHPRLGRGTALDAGRCHVVALGARDYDLTTPQGLADWLRIDPTSELYPAPTDEIAEPASPPLAFDVECSIVGGLMCGSGQAEAAADGESKINRVVQRRDGYFVPASTLKGVLRSRAEYICRAVGAVACERQDCGQCVPCKIFGYSREDSADSAQDMVPQARRAKIVIQDALIADAEKSERQHVAIDRFTGGARAQLLYRDEVIVKGRFRIQIQELRPLDETERLLINAVLHDLHDGRIGIGTRTSSGFGNVHVTDPDLEAPENRMDLSLLARQLAPRPEPTA